MSTAHRNRHSANSAAVGYAKGPAGADARHPGRDEPNADSRARAAAAHTVRSGPIRHSSTKRSQNKLRRYGRIAKSPRPTGQASPRRTARISPTAQAIKKGPPKRARKPKFPAPPLTGGRPEPQNASSGKIRLGVCFQKMDFCSLTRRAADLRPAGVPCGTALAKKPANDDAQGKKTLLETGPSARSCWWS